VFSTITEIVNNLSRYNTSAALCSVCYAPISVAGNMIVSL